jgi:hypothetical protein
MKLAASLLCGLALCVTAFPQRRVVTAAQANGTYEYRDNEIRILALGHNKLRIQMDLIYAFKSSDGPTAHTGQSRGEATIEGDVATFHPEGFADCTITIKFLRGNKIRVSEENLLNCGWGFNVTSEGTYRKVRGGKPRFDERR